MVRNNIGPPPYQPTPLFANLCPPWSIEPLFITRGPILPMRHNGATFPLLATAQVPSILPDEDPPVTYPFGNLSRIPSRLPRGFYKPHNYHHLQQHLIKNFLEQHADPTRFDRTPLPTSSSGISIKELSVTLPTLEIIIQPPTTVSKILPFLMLYLLLVASIL
ncbi:hypothetical protein VP01_1152g2 [Puccinia sorghi]|uniref:Uncharacterized protein n=1 Tax=Puccinia sorghi TaxID=27349 RepID=A0A0L6VT48_9BASI|nr:hypothetical protein VP01_1152g2 [Puccinia sorghi]